MNADGSQAIRNLNNVYYNIHGLLKVLEKTVSNVSEVATKLRYLECSVEQLRESILNISDISSNDDYQRAKIASLKKAITAKDTLISKYRNDGYELFK